MHLGTPNKEPRVHKKLKVGLRSPKVCQRVHNMRSGQAHALETLQIATIVTNP